MREVVVVLALAVMAGCASVSSERQGVAGVPEAQPGAKRTVKRTLNLMQGTAYQGVSETYITDESPGASYYFYDTIEVSGWKRKTQALLAFDEIQVPAGAKIREAFITLAMERKEAGDPGKLCAHMMLVNCDFERVTWEHLDTNNALRWGNDSQASPKEGVDYEAAPTGQSDTSGLQAGDVLKLEVTEAVRRWVSDPGHNYGLLMRTDDGKAVGAFVSSKTPDMSRRPRLYVTYTLELVKDRQASRD